MNTKLNNVHISKVKHVYFYIDVTSLLRSVSESN